MLDPSYAARTRAREGPTSCNERARQWPDQAWSAQTQPWALPEPSGSILWHLFALGRPPCGASTGSIPPAPEMPFPQPSTPYPLSFNPTLMSDSTLEAEGGVSLLFPLNFKVDEIVGRDRTNIFELQPVPVFLVQLAHPSVKVILLLLLNQEG